MADEPFQDGESDACKLSPAGRQEDGSGLAAVETYWAPGALLDCSPW